MPYLPTAQEWLTQSALLLQARPTTTRISTKYTLIPPSNKARSKSSKTTKAEPTATSTISTTTTSPDAPVPAAVAPTPVTRAMLTLKTYDPASGVTLKYRTDKQAEVGRLVSSLARLGRTMAGLPELKDDVAMVDAQTLDGGENVSGVATPVSGGGGIPVATMGQTGGQGGKKGKKKNRK